MLMNRPVVVMQLPEQLDLAQAQNFLQELAPLFEHDRPRIVLDCSQVRYIDNAGIETLLHCLEESMKRDGDLKLAALSPQSAVMLELVRVDRIFEIFHTSEEAVRSFQSIPVDATAQDGPWYVSVFGELGALKQAS
jgi:anti-sigma B factor antagonist